jgi:hypothetical protein
MGRRSGVAIAVVVAIALLGWRFRPSDERTIRDRLDRLAADFNASTTDGLGTVAHAAQLGSYFTEDIVVDLGPGTAPIAGRDTLIGMAARLQPRTASFRVELADVNVAVSADRAHADVNLTASFIRRSITTGEQSIDAREFAVDMRKTGREWNIARVASVDTLR